MKYMRRFKDEVVVIFDDDQFHYKERPHVINGMTGVDVKNQRIQIRDDIHIAELFQDAKNPKKFIQGKPFTFYMVMQVWDHIQPQLFEILRKKNFISRSKV